MYITHQKIYYLLKYTFTDGRMNLLRNVVVALCLLFGAFEGNGSVFWTEGFDNPTKTSIGLLANSYVGINGSWTLSLTGTNQTFANQWCVSNNLSLGKRVSLSNFLPSVSNNKPSLRIAFNWKNNNTIASDPSLAVDDITLSAPAANTISTETISPTTYCAGDAISIPFTSVGTFNAGNFYTAQLSNSSGSFASPVSLGALSSTANLGTISGTIPSGTGAGTGYLIRVVSSNPSSIGSSSVAITIKPLPDATTASTSYLTCSGSTATIAIFSLLSGTTFNWSGDDGSSGSGNPISRAHINDLCSDIVVSYTITPVNDGCTGASIIRPVTVKPYPTSYFSVTPNPSCTDLSTIVTFTGTSCPGATFTWTLPTGTTPINISGIGPHQLKWATSGLKVINLQVVNPSGACTSFLTRDSIQVIGTPALTPTNLCAGTNPTFTTGNGNFYEFLLNGVSQGAISATSTYTPGSALSANDQVCVRSYNKPQFVYDGIIDEVEWGTAISNSRRGPATSGFGDNNIDAIYMNNGYGNLNIAISGRLVNEASPNKILLFIDSKVNGFNNLNTWFARGGTPYKSMENLNSSISFDAGFSPDYILGINGNFGDYFFDLYDMQGNSNNNLGSLNNNPTQFGYTANSGVGDYYNGFEFTLPLSAIGNPTGTIQVFAMIVNDPGLSGAPTFLSNQFLSRANISENNFGDGSITPIVFANAAPNPIPYTIGPDCYKETCVTVNPKIPLSIAAPGPFCEGATPNPLPGTINGVSGTWNPSTISTSVLGNRDHIFTSSAGQCADPLTITININPLPTSTPIYHD